MLHREHTHNNVSVDALKCGKRITYPVGSGGYVISQIHVCTHKHLWGHMYQFVSPFYLSCDLCRPTVGAAVVDVSPPLCPQETVLATSCILARSPCPTLAHCWGVFAHGLAGAGVSCGKGHAGKFDAGRIHTGGPENRPRSLWDRHAKESEFLSAYRDERCTARL